MYEGFHHLCDIQGDVEKTTLYYIIRNHDYETLKRQMNDFNEAANTINNKYNGNFVNVILKENYKNMKEVILAHPEVLETVTKAYDKLKMNYEFMPIRGGTDGANLSFMGLPCPNLGDGGYNFHGRFEYVSVSQMRKMVKLLIEIIKA